MSKGVLREGKAVWIKYIFVIKMLVEGNLGKDRKLYAAFMDVVKAYDVVDREAFWNLLKICGVGDT